MIKYELILIGAGGHARSCIDVIEQQGYFQIAGLIGLPEQKEVKPLEYGYDVIGVDSDLSRLASSYKYALIAIGQIKSAEHRIQLYDQVRQLGFKLPTIVSPTAYVSRHATIGVGTIVMHGAIVNAGASIGDNCIINSCALIEHDVRVGDHCHISTGAILNGGVNVGAGSFIGSGSVAKHGITIGDRCVVGMGTLVRHNLSDQMFFTG